MNLKETSVFCISFYFVTLITIFVNFELVTYLLHKILFDFLQMTLSVITNISYIAEQKI